MFRCLICLLTLNVLGLGTAVRAKGAPADQPVDFDRDVRPILFSRCVGCHGAGEAEAGLRLDSSKAAKAKLESGSTAVVARRPEESELLRRVASADPDNRMPPEGEPLTSAEIDALRRWIAAGAGWPVHWAYQPLDRPQPPSDLSPASTQWVQSPIDAFIAQKLAEHQLAPSPPADRRTLLRRVYFDLLGLPPTPEAFDAFLHDDAPDAYERVVDSLLASPRYGERWARHWMDLVHFAETHGHDQDRPREHAWPYRDYLIRSLNADKPYAQFVREQIAGDALYDDDPWATVATGFLAAGPWDESSLRDIQADSLDRQIGHYLDRDDIVTTTFSTFVSTTVHCARCHDHKFDPVTQREYYNLQAVFAGTDKADRRYDPDPQIASRRRQLTDSLMELARQRGRADPALLHTDRQVPLEAEGIPPAVAAVLAIAPQQRTDAQRAELAAFVTEQQLQRRLASLPPEQRVYCGTSRFTPDGSFKPAAVPRPVHVLHRGEISKPLDEAEPGALTLLPELSADLDLPQPADDAARRAALATWLADERNVLTWRSIANRLWQYHIGRGIVDTPSDFGRMGHPPSHPELLDWLAVELRDGGGSLKSLHRRIVTSAAYRQASRYDSPFAEQDADNRFLWRMNRRRLEAESIRDATLQLSGCLDLTMGGPSVKQFVQTPGVHVTPVIDYTGFDVDAAANYRRSVYRFLFRTLPDPFMEALDCPDASQLAPQRNESVTALQALSLLNDKLMIRLSEHVAQRAASSGDGLPSQIAAAYRLILCRLPSNEEEAAVSQYAAEHGLANTCRFLLNTNEFIFVD